MRSTREEFSQKLRMVGVDFQRGEQESPVTRLVTAALRLNGYKYRIDLRQGFWIITFQDPAFSGGVVFVEDTQVDGSLAVGTTPPPSLERARSFDFGLLIEIVRIKDQRLAARIEDSAIRLLGFTRASHVVDFRDVKVAGADDVPDIAIMGEELIALLNGCLLLLKLLGEFIDLG